MGSYHILVEGLRWLARAVMLGTQPLRLHITIRCLGGDLHNVGIVRRPWSERTPVGRRVLHWVLIPEMRVTSIGVEVITWVYVKLARSFNWIYRVLLISWARLCMAGNECDVPTFTS